MKRAMGSVEVYATKDAKWDWRIKVHHAGDWDVVADSANQRYSRRIDASTVAEKLLHGGFAETGELKIDRRPDGKWSWEIWVNHAGDRDLVAWDARQGYSNEADARSTAMKLLHGEYSPVRRTSPSSGQDLSPLPVDAFDEEKWVD